eukprot:scaffold708_cov86-Isochrysis_galbana.AAC.3
MASRPCSTQNNASRCPTARGFPSASMDRLKQNASANDTPNGSRKRDQVKTITGVNTPWGHSGNLKEGTSPEGKGR